MLFSSANNTQKYLDSVDYSRARERASVRGENRASESAHKSCVEEEKQAGGFCPVLSLTSDPAGSASLML